jgi:hypothetical protein
MRLRSGGEGRIELGERQGGATVILTPAVGDAAITIVFDITEGDRRLRPTLVVSRTAPGSIEWVAAQGRTVRLTVSWIR